MLSETVSTVEIMDLVLNEMGTQQGGRELEGYGRGLFESSSPSFACIDCRKPKKVSVG
jgi:hypothetical protein